MAEYKCNDFQDIQDQALGDNEITDFDQLNDDDDDEDDNYDFEYDEGIHVYGTDHDETKGTPRQFVDINDYASRYVDSNSFLNNDHLTKYCCF